VVESERRRAGGSSGAIIFTFRTNRTTWAYTNGQWAMLQEGGINDTGGQLNWRAGGPERPLGPSSLPSKLIR